MALTLLRDAQATWIGWTYGKPALTVLVSSAPRVVKKLGVLTLGSRQCNKPTLRSPCQRCTELSDIKLQKREFRLVSLVTLKLTSNGRAQICKTTVARTLELTASLRKLVASTAIMPITSDGIDKRFVSVALNPRFRKESVR